MKNESFRDKLAKVFRANRGLGEEGVEAARFLRNRLRANKDSEYHNVSKSNSHKNTEHSKQNPNLENENAAKEREWGEKVKEFCEVLESDSNIQLVVSYNGNLTPHETRETRCQHSKVFDLRTKSFKESLDGKYDGGLLTLDSHNYVNENKETGLIIGKVYKHNGYLYFVRQIFFNGNNNNSYSTETRDGTHYTLGIRIRDTEETRQKLSNLRVGNLFTDYLSPDRKSFNQDFRSLLYYLGAKYMKDYQEFVIQSLKERTTSKLSKKGIMFVDGIRISD